MSESNWKVADVSQLIPVGVLLHNADTGEDLEIAALYNPVTDAVHSLQPWQPFQKAQVEQAVKQHVKSVKPEELDDPVSPKTWDAITVLTGLARSSITQET